MLYICPEIIIKILNHKLIKSMKTKCFSKAILLSLFVYCLTINAYCQSVPKNRIGVHFYPGVVSYKIAVKIGDYNTYANGIGIDYSRLSLSNTHWDFSTGLSYVFRRKIHPDAIRMVTIPVELKYHLGKLFFINGGMMMNISDKTPHYPMSKERFELFFGFGLGVGIEYEFSSGFTLSLNPSARYYGKLDDELFTYMRRPFLHSGVNIGAGYKF